MLQITLFSWVLIPKNFLAIEKRTHLDGPAMGFEDASMFNLLPSREWENISHQTGPSQKTIDSKIHWVRICYLVPRRVSSMKKSCNVWIHLSSFTYLEPHGQPFINGFQLDDSKSLYRKWLFHQTSIYKWLALGFQVVTVFLTLFGEKNANVEKNMDPIVELLTLVALWVRVTSCGTGDGERKTTRFWGAFWNCSQESFCTNFSCEKTVIWVETKRCPGCLDSPISVVYVLKYQRLMEGKRHKKSVQQDCPKISMGFHAYIVSSQISNLISRPHFNLKGNPPEA